MQGLADDMNSTALNSFYYIRALRILSIMPVITFSSYECGSIADYPHVLSCILRGWIKGTSRAVQHCCLCHTAQIKTQPCAV